MSQKTLPDEQIVAAILQHGTIKDAAQALGASPRTLYERMNKESYRNIYNATVAGVLRQAAYTLQQQLGEAIAVTVEIMKDEKNSAQIRLQAAQTIYANASKFLAAAHTADAEVQKYGEPPADMLKMQSFYK